MNDNLQEDLVISKDWTEEETKVVCDGLIKYNRRSSRPLDEQWSDTINLILKTKDDKVVGGIMCNMFMYSLYIDVLWVDEKYRGHDYGSKLIAGVEEIAKEKGCILVDTCTYSYQSPDFYVKCGYEIYGILEGFPEGIKKYHLKKVI
ncbi:GNAT family N-acetyltransferase [Paenibacillus allorhizosphaerae]|uniref:Acetyltransferase n=1 Tax=Paenibacillus allorhizosphaerae TaxID=2849866 RepID=A0ABM8VV53_9BACL|nr:GNAT family N-acetyltransferase [Paenibacillus allorhizosphaerae]CAG7659067.1 Acetyltransferase [Paenibacillus allorhizosphaerae]